VVAAVSRLSCVCNKPPLQSHIPQDHEASTLFVWLELALCVAVIVYAGARLTRYGDAIADKTELGDTWIGVVLIALVTSLPELATGISSVAVVGVPDIAVGDVLGSCAFNLLILAAVDILNRPDGLYRAASQGHIVSSGFGVVMLAVIGLGLVLSHAGLVLAIWRVGVYSILLLVLYATAVRTVFHYEKVHVGEFADREPDRYPQITLMRASVRYALAAAAVVLSGIALPFAGRALADQMGWHQSFVGTLLIGMATSLPEVVVTLAAVRLGALDMAVGSLFGSNLFDAAILGLDDLLYRGGPLLAQVSPSHSASAFTAIIMTGVTVVGLIDRPHRIRHLVGWASLSIVAVYLLNAFVQYRFGSSLKVHLGTTLAGRSGALNAGAPGPGEAGLPLAARLGNGLWRLLGGTPPGGLLPLMEGLPPCFGAFVKAFFKHAAFRDQARHCQCAKGRPVGRAVAGAIYGPRPHPADCRPDVRGCLCPGRCAVPQRICHPGRGPFDRLHGSCVKFGCHHCDLLSLTT
jgi:cation:H+ antiporter